MKFRKRYEQSRLHKCAVWSMGSIGPLSRRHTQLRVSCSHVNPAPHRNPFRLAQHSAGVPLQVLAGVQKRMFQPRQLANLIWALATLGARDDEAAVVTAIAEACLDADVRAFKEQEMSNVVWALATLGAQSLLVSVQIHAASAAMHAFGLALQETQRPTTCIQTFAASSPGSKVLHLGGAEAL